MGFAKGESQPYDLELDPQLPPEIGEPAPVVWGGSVSVVCVVLCCTEHYVHIIPAIYQTCRQSVCLTLTSNTKHPNLI